MDELSGWTRGKVDLKGDDGLWFGNNLVATGVSV